MAKAHCDKHKRYVPSCVECQSAALRETVGFPKTKEQPEEETTSGAYVGGGSSESESDDEEGGDIADWEPEVEEEVPTDQVEGEPAAPGPLPSYTPSPENACNEHPDGCPEGSHRPDSEELCPGCGHSFDTCECPYPERVDAEAEIDEKGRVQEVSLVPGEGEPNIPDGTPNLAEEMSPIDAAMFMFPARLIPEGATEVCDEERPNEPYMASYEELIRRSVAGYLELGLTPEDAVVVVAAEVIHADQLDFEEEDGPNVVDKEGFDAGIEAAPELTGCIKDYNQGFNEGMSALHKLLIGYFAGDEDSIAYKMMRWLERQMLTMEKK